MASVQTLDPSTPLRAQLQQETGPVVMINTFFVPREDFAEFMSGFQADALLMKDRPGYISSQLHQGTAGSQLLVNVAVWESTQALAQAHADPRFRERSGKLPEGVIAYPHVFQKIAVDGICGD